MPIVFASPVAVPVSAVLEARFMSWTGVDGSVWPLSDVYSFPAMGRGVKGLHMPEMTVFESSTPLVPGVDITGYALPKRKVYWPLMFAAESADAWAASHAAFFDSFHPVEMGTWTVGTGDQARTLQLRGDFRGDYAFGMDPFVSGWAMIGVELEAPRPLWQGKPVGRTFYAEDEIDFIPDEDGDDYYPSPNATFSTATLRNPGDEPAYLKWIVRGPHPANTLSLGVSEADVEVPFTVDEGSELRIDTDPASESYATLDGVDVTDQLGFQVFAPIPRRGVSTLTIEHTGTGSVRAEVVPLHWRAF